jgi:hypothetical protein
MAMTAALLSVLMAVVYIRVIHEQGSERPLVWVVAVLLVGAVMAGYGARRSAPSRRTALVVAGVLLIGLGVLALLSIGLPIILAGLLCLISAARTPPTAPAGN